MIAFQVDWRLRTARNVLFLQKNEPDGTLFPAHFPLNYVFHAIHSEFYRPDDDTGRDVI